MGMWGRTVTCGAGACVVVPLVICWLAGAVQAWLRFVWAKKCELPCAMPNGAGARLYHLAVPLGCSILAFMRGG